MTLMASARVSVISLVCGKDPIVVVGSTGRQAACAGRRIAYGVRTGPSPSASSLALTSACTAGAAAAGCAGIASLSLSARPIATTSSTFCRAKASRPVSSGASEVSAARSSVSVRVQSSWRDRTWRYPA
jgi:hypothetical protein